MDDTRDESTDNDNTESTESTKATRLALALFNFNFKMHLITVEIKRREIENAALTLLMDKRRLQTSRPQR